MEKQGETATKKYISIRTEVIFWLIFILATWFMFSLLIDLATNVHTAIRLKNHGVETIATISEYTPQKERIYKFWERFSHLEPRHLHTVTYNGISNIIELDQQYPVNNRISLIYDKDNPRIVWINTIPLTAWKLLSTNMKIAGFTRGDIVNVLLYSGLLVATFYILIKNYIKNTDST